jgi:hypothetical protein
MITNTAMIGSLPYAGSLEALEALSKFSLGIPSWPQLPKRSFKESMTVQYTEGFPGIMVDEKEKRVWLERDDRLLDSMATFYDAVVAGNLEPFEISASYAAGLHGFMESMRKSGRKYPFLKGQVVGPFTFGFGLTDAEGRAAWFDEQYQDIVLKGITMKATWQARQLSTFAEKVVIFLDEPIYSALGTPTYIGIENDHVVSALNEIAEALHGLGALVGVHCCGNMEWSLLARTDIDIISFDAYSFGDKVSLYATEIGVFLKRGGILAWGIVPTDTSDHVANESEKSLLTKIAATEELFERKGVARELLKRQRILTPSCGLGNLTQPEALRVLELLKALSVSAGN